MQYSVRKRPIDKRYIPNIVGIDLEHAINYIDVEHVGIEFMYEHYTASRLAYIKGARPRLENVAEKITEGGKSELKKVQALVLFVAHSVSWVGYYYHKTKELLPLDRNATEEELLTSGYGWCNEQARVLCSLTQVIGIPSRLIFVSNKQKIYGHVVCEVLLNNGWMLIDQSFGYCFHINNKPIRATEVFHDRNARKYFGSIYKNLCLDMIEKIGLEIVKKSFSMAASENPLDGFTNIGFYNYFVQ